MDGHPLYVAARPFYPIRPSSVDYPESLTRAKASRLGSFVGATVEVSTRQTPYPNTGFNVAVAAPHGAGSAFVEEAQWVDLDNRGELDGALILRLLVTPPEFVDALVERRDLELPYEVAEARNSAHWGTQNWGGLTLQLRHGADVLFTCDVDVFFPEDADYGGPQVKLVIYSARDQSADTHELTDGLTQPIRPPKTTEAGWEQPELTGAETVVGACGECGSRLYALPAMINVAIERGGGFVMVPCYSCRRSRLFRILSTTEGRRKGYRFEEVQPKLP